MTLLHQASSETDLIINYKKKWTRYIKKLEPVKNYMLLTALLMALTNILFATNNTAFLILTAITLFAAAIIRECQFQFAQYMSFIQGERTWRFHDGRNDIGNLSIRVFVKNGAAYEEVQFRAETPIVYLCEYPAGNAPRFKKILVHYAKNDAAFAFYYIRKIPVYDSLCTIIPLS